MALTQDLTFFRLYSAHMLCWEMNLLLSLICHYLCITEFTWTGYETVGAGTCSLEPLQSASRGSSSNTWRTPQGNPECALILLTSIFLTQHISPMYPVSTFSPYRGPQQGWTFSSRKSSHTFASLWQPDKEQWQCYYYYYFYYCNHL